MSFVIKEMYTETVTRYGSTPPGRLCSKSQTITGVGEDPEQPEPSPSAGANTKQRSRDGNRSAFLQKVKHGNTL